MFDSGLNSENS